MPSHAAENRLRLDSEPGDYIGAGLLQEFGSADGVFAGNWSNAAHLSFIAPGFSHWWFLDFAAIGFFPPFVGTYTGATRYPFESPSVPGLSIYGDGRGCNQDFGSFTVLEATYGANGTILGLAADFEQHCEFPGAPALRGEIRLNSCIDMPDGTPCDDGDLCRATFTCQGGLCSGTPTTCPATDQCHAAGTCDPTTGLCSNPLKPNGVPCDAGIPDTCSVADTCQTGVCVPGGGGDADGDGICNLDDDCPTVSDPAQVDLDGDGAGDRCDSADAPLMLEDVRLRRSSGSSTRGTIRARGTLLTAPPTDVLTPTSGITVRVTDGAAMHEVLGWSAQDCVWVPSTSIACTSPDRNARLRFRTLQGSAALYEFRLTARRLPLAPPLLGPVTVVVTHGDRVDRVGALDTCRITDAGVRCKIL